MGIDRAKPQRWTTVKTIPMYILICTNNRQTKEKATAKIITKTTESTIIKDKKKRRAEIEGKKTTQSKAKKREEKKREKKNKGKSKGPKTRKE